MVSLLISNSTVTNSSRVVFNSKENASHPPQLVAIQGSAREYLMKNDNPIHTSAPALLSAYPNPAGNQFTIRSSQNLAGKKLQLFSSEGNSFMKEFLLILMSNGFYRQPGRWIVYTNG